ncbi:hypothetical protein ABT369_39300 [Dactylosporangium sp. NPDC000244]|uniref:hypothetical protein n=1 Tax=Dactylosporangium sp. NPDC000244 TaxID=3154365 RepID=UPI003320C843
MMKRIAIVTALAVLVLAACGTAAPADNGCGTNTSPCHGAGNTLPDGWTVTEVQVNGRTVTCITWFNPQAAAGAPVALSCDWTPR